MVVKKGSSHVEIMISFVIFIGFLLFFYTIISPAIKGPRSSDTVLEDYRNGILNYVQEEVEEWNLGITEVEGDNLLGSCFEINSPPSTKNSIVKLIEEEEMINTHYSPAIPDNLETETNEYSPSSLSIKEPPEGGQKFKIFFSDGFNKSKEFSSCTKISEDESSKSYYTKNFQKKRNYVFESKINEMKEKYLNEKEDLRLLLKIPEKYDFWFDFLNVSRDSFWGGWEEPDIGTENIYVDEFAISYIDELNQDPENKQQGSLRIILWG